MLSHGISAWSARRPGVLRFMGSQRVGHDWATDLIWSDVYLTPWYTWPHSPLARPNYFTYPPTVPFLGFLWTYSQSAPSPLAGFSSLHRFTSISFLHAYTSISLLHCLHIKRFFFRSLPFPFPNLFFIIISNKSDLQLKFHGTKFSQLPKKVSRSKIA